MTDTIGKGMEDEQAASEIITKQYPNAQFDDKWQKADPSDPGNLDEILLVWESSDRAKQGADPIAFLHRPGGRGEFSFEQSPV
jgi:hypothetical protein